MKRALIISDKKPGHFNQSIALCKHLDLEYEILEVAYKSKIHKALSYALDRLSIYTASLFSEPFNIPVTPFYVIISTGSTTYYANKLLARKFRLPNIAILKPSGYRLNFTHIFCPAYDQPPQRENITELPLNLCASEKAFFEEKADEFLLRHTPDNPSVGMIIGGNNAVSELVPDQLKTALDQIFALTEGMERWITTSPRTPGPIEDLINTYSFDFKLISSSDSYNPIPAFIQLCDRLVVTSDSASMISECASFGDAKVEILMNKQLKSPNKFEKLISGLVDKNAAHVFDGSFGDADRKVDLNEMLKKAAGI